MPNVSLHFERERQRGALHTRPWQTALEHVSTRMGNYGLCTAKDRSKYRAHQEGCHRAELQEGAAGLIVAAAQVLIAGAAAVEA